jgi:tetratricopeptide (TPR) repeat protein
MARRICNTVDIKNLKPDQEQIVITDPKTGEMVGYLTDTTFYDYNEIKHAFEYLDKGLVYGPNRLDMHFGKIHLLNAIKDYQNAGKTLIDLLNLSIVNKNKWLWSDNEAINDGENILLDSIQDYYQVWFNDWTDDSQDTIYAVCLEQIKLYPANIYAFNNLTSYYTINEKFDEALSYLLKAEKIDENDIIVLSNIAHYYKVMGNKEMAKKYYVRQE